MEQGIQQGWWVLVAMVTLGMPLRASAAAEGVALQLADHGHNHATVTMPATGVWEIHTTGGDPFVLTTLSATPVDLAATPVLAFDYVCVSGLDLVEVFAGPGWSGERRVQAERLPAREGWSPFAIDVTANERIATSKATRWRIDLGSKPGKVIQVRNLRLRPRSAEEIATAAARERRLAADRALDSALSDYLTRVFPAQLTHVSADATNLTVSGRVPAGGRDVLLAEWPVWQAAETTMRFVSTWPVSAPAVELTIPRLGEDGRDRALSRFVLIRRSGGQDTLLSSGRWVDDIPAATTLKTVVPRGKKGIGGFSIGRGLDSDLDDLGISSLTVNIVLSSLFQAGPGKDAEAVVAGGRTWYVRRNAFDHYDATAREAAKRGIVLLGIILVPPAQSWAAKDLGALMQHPEYLSSGIYTMPNLTTAESTAAYTLALELLAKRYSRDDGKYGRIHHWIMHNEVDMGFVWTNCGRRPELVFFDQYHRSMRLARAVLKRQDASAQVFISLTHHWARTGDPSTCFPALNLMQHLLAFCRVEGDFDWGLAHHPYPSSLLEPRTWEDRDAHFRLDTPKITFRNIEVLDAWMRQPLARYQGKTVRTIHLSEQGPNSPDYSEKSLTEQAAAMAYVWKKLARLDSIQGFQFHNWIDNRSEGGLRIGLRRFPDDPEQPLGAKPVWHVYKALETPDEDRACAFALPVIGLKTWDEAIHRGPIPATTVP